MPELPEVETIVRGLRPLLEGRRVEAVWWSGKALHMRRPVDVRGLRPSGRRPRHSLDNERLLFEVRVLDAGASRQ